MTHRYLSVSWWICRVADETERLVSPRLTMPALVWAARRGERELDGLAYWVSRDKLALDIGANRGIYTWCLAKLARAVHAFEPNAELAERLRRAVPGATVHACALSDREGEGELRLPVVKGIAYDGWATVEPQNRLLAVGPDSVRSIRVPLRTLDSFGLEDVGFVKIDAEGHELAVLRGAERTLARCRPIVLLEVEDRHRPGASEDVSAFLRALGYEMYAAPSVNMQIARSAQT